MPPIVVDTSAIYAAVVRQDRNHAAAARFVREHVNQGGGFVLLDLVFAECLALLKARHGSGVAVEVGRRLRDPTVFRWQGLSPQLESQAWSVFERYIDKDWSYTDCALFGLARQLGTPEVFTFGRHFRQMPGLTLIPRP